jgi:hypothetical protein
MYKPDEWKYECKWHPEKDITTYELAQCIPFMFSKLHDPGVWDRLDRGVTRHFLVSHFNYTEMIKEQAKKLRDSLDIMD